MTNADPNRQLYPVIGEHAPDCPCLACTAVPPKTAAARFAGRANLIREQLRQLEQDLHTLEGEATEHMNRWRWRSAEVKAQHAGEIVWSLVCTLEAGS